MAALHTSKKNTSGLDGTPQQIIQHAWIPKGLCAATLSLQKQLSIQRVPQSCVDFAICQSLKDGLLELSQYMQCFWSSHILYPQNGYGHTLGSQ